MPKAQFRNDDTGKLEEGISFGDGEVYRVQGGKLVMAPPGGEYLVVEDGFLVLKPINVKTSMGWSVLRESEIQPTGAWTLVMQSDLDGTIMYDVFDFRDGSGTPCELYEVNGNYRGWVTGWLEAGGYVYAPCGGYKLEFWWSGIALDEFIRLSYTETTRNLTQVTKLKTPVVSHSYTEVVDYETVLSCPECTRDIAVEDAKDFIVVIQPTSTSNVRYSTPSWYPTYASLDYPVVPGGYWPFYHTQYYIIQACQLNYIYLLHLFFFKQF